MYFYFSCFLFILGILTYKWQVDFNNGQINVEVTFKKTDDKNQNSQSTTSGNVERPIDSMRYYLYDIPFIVSRLFIFGGINLQLQNIFFLFCSDWIAVGFSNYGDFDNADFCVFWIDWKGKAHLQVRLKTLISSKKNIRDMQNATFYLVAYLSMHT